MTALLFVACQNNEKQEAAAETEGAVPEMTVEQKKQQLQRVAPGSTTTNAGAASGNINPPHGQPGHRCDVPVGAPLDGGAATKQPVKVNPTSNTMTPTGNTNVTINPPHGQPGHRCDVKVGDPLPTS